MKQYRGSHDKALDASTPLLSQGSPPPKDAEGVTAEDAVDITREAFEHLAKQSGELDEWNNPVLPPADVASVIMAVCEYSGQKFGMKTPEELTQRIITDVDLTMKQGGHGIQVDKQVWGDEDARCNFSGLMLLLSRHPFKKCLPSVAHKRIPGVLMLDMRDQICGSPAEGSGPTGTDA